MIADVPALDALCTICALDEPVNVPTLARVLRSSTRRARELAERLVESGAVRVNGEAARVRAYVVHEARRDAVVRALRARPAVHERVVDYLERSTPNQRARIADHLVAAGRFERAAEYLEAEAVAAFQRRDPLAARTALQRAISLLPRGSVRAAALEERRAAAARDLGAFVEAERCSARAAELYAAQGRRDDAARALLARARTWLPLAAPRRALVLAARALALAGDERLQAEIAGFRDAASAYVGEAPADPRGAASLEGQFAQGLRAFADGSPRLAASRLELALTRAESAGEERLAQEILRELGRAALWSGETERARDLADELVARATAFGLVDTLQRARLARAALLRLCGDYRAAHEELARTLRTWQSIPRDEVDAYAIGVPIAVQAGDDEMLRRWTRRDVMRSAAECGAFAVGDAAHASIMLAERAGDHEAARGIVERILGTLSSGMHATWLLIDAARLGFEPQRTAALARHAAATARTAPYEAVDAMVRACGTSGAEGERLARDAAVRFDALGWYDARDAALRRAPARPPEGGEGTLTARQVEVARLAAAGHTNREIAGVLRISVHTVEHHVTAILRRRGLRSRWQLAEPGGMADAGLVVSR